MVLEVLVQAMGRRDEVFQVIEDSEDMDEQSVGSVSCWVWESWAAGQSSTSRLEDSPGTSVRQSLPV